MIVKGGYIYIISNYTRTVLYTGVTSDLFNRIYEHKNGIGSAFTSKYQCKYLLHFEFFETIEEAITREKNIKKWKREWKINLIKEKNPTLSDLSDAIEDYR